MFFTTWYEGYDQCFQKAGAWPTRSGAGFCPSLVYSDMLMRWLVGHHISSNLEQFTSLKPAFFELL